MGLHQGRNHILVPNTRACPGVSLFSSGYPNLNNGEGRALSMIKALRFLACTFLVVSMVSCSLPEALASIGDSCRPQGGDQEFIFSVWGESQHWALILTGVATCKDGRIDTAKALPYLVWAGGPQSPERANVTFVVQDITCVKGTIGVRPTKVVRVADCKLVSPGVKLITAASPEDLVQAITSTGRFEIAWNGMTELITWRYGYPPPAKNR